MFLRFYLIYGAAMCAWLTAAAFGGWHAVRFEGGGYSSGSGGSGPIIFAPGRGSGGSSSSWHGGK